MVKLSIPDPVLPTATKADCGFPSEGAGEKLMGDVLTVKFAGSSWKSAAVAVHAAIERQDHRHEPRDGIRHGGSGQR